MSRFRFKLAQHIKDMEVLTMRTWVITAHQTIKPEAKAKRATFWNYADVLRKCQVHVCTYVPYLHSCAKLCVVRGMVWASAAVRLSIRCCPFHAHLFQQEARQNRSSKSIVIVFKQQQQHPPHNVLTWSSLFSSTNGAEPLNNDLQRVSEFLLHDINWANFTTRLHNNS